MAQQLLKVLPGPLHLMIGVTLIDPKTGQKVTLDLVGLAQAVAFVGLDIHQSSKHTLTPSAAAHILADLMQRERMLAQPLPIYAFWLGKATPGEKSDDTIILPDATAVKKYIQLAQSGTIALSNGILTALTEEILTQDVDLKEHKHSLVSHLRHSLQGLINLPKRIDAGLQKQVKRSYLFRRSGAILPADVNKHLESAMLARENVLEDADYGKIVPNDYVVELGQDNYQRNYEPIKHRICEHWQTRLEETLNTTNARWGHTAYRFGAKVRVRLEPSSGLTESEVRISCQVNIHLDANQAAFALACLEFVSGGYRWPLHKDRITIGRDKTCDISLDSPAIQEARLVSGRHACIIHKDKDYILFDGDSKGKSSTNGTFVNYKSVKAKGQKLNDGDIVILAALDHNQPHPDTPGVAAFIFRLDCW